jgi:hypothetical protein
MSEQRTTQETLSQEPYAEAVLLFASLLVLLAYAFFTPV